MKNKGMKKRKFLFLNWGNLEKRNFVIEVVLLIFIVLVKFIFRVEIYSLIFR